jgi:hypothetical protein
MIGFYPGRGAEQATHLKNEGVMIQARSGKYKVMNLKDALWTK